MKWKVLKTELFEKKFRKLDKSIQQQIEDIRDQLKENPFVGRALESDYFREKKVGKFRIYYLIYKDENGSCKGVQLDFDGNLT